MKRAGIYHRPDESPIERDHPRLEVIDSRPEAIRRMVAKYQGDIFKTEVLTEIFIVVDARETLVFIVYGDVTILVPRWSLRSARTYLRTYEGIA